MSVDQIKNIDNTSNIWDYPKLIKELRKQVNSEPLILAQVEKLLEEIKKTAQSQKNTNQPKS